jgi:uncharacterized protein (TIGR02246 family)
MKILRITLVLALVVFGGSLGVAADTDSALNKEITDFVQAYTQAFQAKDLDAIMAMYSENAVLLGTGPGERYEGMEEIRGAYMEYLKAFDKEESTLTWYKAASHGDVVWASGMSQLVDYFKNIKTQFAMNWSLVLVKQDGAWKFAQRHISNISCE